jgi:hypothetical protein
MRYDYPPESRRLWNGSIAIWNTQKIVVIVAMGIWVTDIAFFMNGKYLLQVMGEPLLNLVISQASYG